MAKSAFDQFCQDYRRLESDSAAYSWSALDRALVHVCATTPLHTGTDEVYAKVRLINRAYLANLHFGTPDAEWKVAEKFVEGKADAVLDPLRSCCAFSPEALPQLLDSHEQFVKLTMQVTGKAHNSFVSKYLHFHCPEIVPVFDSYAYDAVWKVAQPPEAEFAHYEGRVNRDYGYYCGALLEVMKLLRDHGLKSPRLKLLDVLLYGTRGAANPDGESG